jgi:hypothetical protein
MSSSSLIFSMGAISMKVNPAFVSILIIASSLAIHLSTYTSHQIGSGAFCNWAPIMALTPSPEVFSPIVMGRSDLRLISWPSHLLLRCLRLSSWDSLNLDSYHSPHTFHPRYLHLSSWDGLILDSYHGPHTFCLRCLRLSSCDSLNMDSYHGPHTFYLRCLRLLSYGCLYLGSFHGPHTFYLRCLRPSWSSHILLHRGCLQWLQDSLPPCGLRRDHCHWLHRKRKLRYTPRNPPPRFLCLELLRLSAWQLHLHQLSLVSSPFVIDGRLLSQAFAPPQLGASATALFPSLHALERSSPVVFIKSTRDFLLNKL